MTNDIKLNFGGKVSEQAQNIAYWQTWLLAVMNPKFLLSDSLGLVELVMKLLV